MAADGGNRAAGYEGRLYCKTNTAAAMEYSFQLCLNSQPFHFRMAATAAPMGTLSLDVHVYFELILNCRII